MKYRVLVEQDEDGIFVAEVPSLPGCISQGNTRKEATENIKEAIALYLESLRLTTRLYPHQSRKNWSRSAREYPAECIRS